MDYMPHIGMISTGPAHSMKGTQLRMVGQNSDTGKYSKERELGDVASSQVCYKRRKERWEGDSDIFC
jgi:hypothetical protein